MTETRATIDRFADARDYLRAMDPDVVFRIETMNGNRYVATSEPKATESLKTGGPRSDAEMCLTTDLGGNSYILTQVLDRPGCRMDDPAYVGKRRGLYYGDRYVVYISIGSRRNSPDDWATDARYSDHVVTDLTVEVNGREAVINA